MATARRSRAKKRRITPEDLTRMVLVGDPQISPDGSEILFVQKTFGSKNDYVTNLWRVPAAGGEPRAFTSGGKDGAGRWSPDGHTVAFVRTVKGEGSQIWVIPAAGGEARPLTSFSEGAIGGFRWSPDGRKLAVSFRETAPEWTRKAVKEREEKGLTDPPRVLEDPWYRLDGDGYFDAQRFHLYVVDVADGSHRKLYGRDAMGLMSFDWSPDSRQLAVTTNRDRKAMFRPWKAEIVRVDVKTGKVTPVPNLPDGPKDNVRWSPDGKMLAYAGREGKDDTYSPENVELFVCDARRGRARSLTGTEDFCLMAVALSDTSEASFGTNLQWTPDGRRILFGLGWHGEMHVASVPVAGGKVRFLTGGQYDHAMGNLSADGRTLALVRASGRVLGEVYAGDVKATSVTPRALTAFNRDLLAGLELAPIHKQWIKAADGHPVELWYMRPPGKSLRARVPAVLEIHGGPHAQYGVGFFHEFQVLAAAGYAVFFSNPRGSKGYGRDHCRAIRGHWGGADWEDIQAVTAYMRSLPWVNEKKMGVMGGSYGGYMTNWVIGHTREFAGAITDRCVSNLLSMSGNSDFIQVPDSYWEGNFWDKPEALWRDSPIKYMGYARTPTLIIHSEGDLRCNIEQSEQVFSLLQLKNVPSRFVRYPRTTSHGMSRGGPPDMRLHRLHQILDWWKTHLG